jgi:glycoprotein 6-alpha-L-fucosyltransferase
MLLLLLLLLLLMMMMMLLLLLMLMMMMITMMMMTTTTTTTAMVGWRWVQGGVTPNVEWGMADGGWKRGVRVGGAGWQKDRWVGEWVY